MGTKLIEPSTLGLLLYIQRGCVDDDTEELLKNYLFELDIFEDGKLIHEKLEERGLIEYIKGRKSDPPHKKVRLTTKAQDILKNVLSKPRHKLTSYFYDTLKTAYEKIGAEKTHIKGGDKILGYISDFLHSRPTDYDERMITAVIEAYTGQFENDLKYLRRMDNLIFKPSNVYSTKFNVDSCPLHEFINNNTELIKSYYARIL